MAARAVLSGGFAESSDGSSLLSGYPKPETPYADDYDYESDSDLDDDDDNDPPICILLSTSLYLAPSRLLMTSA